MNIRTVALFVLLMFIFAPLTFAAVETASKDTGIVDAGNTTCPVLGNPASPNITADYQGKRYHFCCYGCVSRFKADPEKYIAILEKEGPTKTL